MSKRRVVVTGLGMVSPLGLSVAETWQSLLAGKSGVDLISNTAFSGRDLSEFNCRIAAQVKNFDPTVAMPLKEARKMDTFIQFGVIAAQEAFLDAGLVVTEENARRMGVAVGSGIGGLPMIEQTHETLMKSGPRRVSPFFIPGSIINLVAGQISIKHHLKGPNISIVTACTTGTHNLGYAARTIAYGDADVMLAGGAEMATTGSGIAGFAACRALSRRNDEPQKASRPWDKDRDGFVLGEGAGVLVLEEYEHAKKRGATIYAELSGFGMSADAFHITAPDETAAGGVAAMQAALQDAGCDVRGIQYINAHGTSTPTGDILEAKAIKQTFGEHAKELAVSSTKSMTGHLLGAAGAVEAIFSVLAIRDQVAPPTINLDNPDDGCDLNFVPHEAQSMPINGVLSNSLGFGGTNGALVFEKI